MSLLQLQENINKLVTSLDKMNTFIEKAEPLIFSEDFFDPDKIKENMESIHELYLKAISRQMSVLDFIRKTLHVPNREEGHEEGILQVADFLNTLSKEDLSIVKQMVKTKQTGMVQ